MEVEGPEGQVLSPEEVADKDVCGLESMPGIVPDGKSDFDNGYDLFSKESVSVQCIWERLPKLWVPQIQISQDTYIALRKLLPEELLEKSPQTEINRVKGI